MVGSCTRSTTVEAGYSQRMLLPLSSFVSTAEEAFQLKYNISSMSKAHGQYPALMSSSGAMDSRERVDLKRCYLENV